MVQAISNVITHFIRLLTLKNKPQNLQYSANTFALLFITLIIAIKLTVQNIAPQLKAINSIIPFMIIGYEGLFLTILYVLLTKSGKGNRFIQSACNFLGVSVISCIASSLIGLLPMPLLFLCLLKSWFLIINFHITKHAFNVTQLQAVWIYFFINMVAVSIIALPFGLMQVT